MYCIIVPVAYTVVPTVTARTLLGREQTVSPILSYVLLLTQKPEVVGVSGGGVNRGQGQWKCKSFAVLTLKLKTE